MGLQGCWIFDCSDFCIGGLRKSGTSELGTTSLAKTKDFGGENSLEFRISRFMDSGTSRLWDFETLGSNPKTKKIMRLMGRSGIWPRADPPNLDTQGFKTILCGIQSETLTIHMNGKQRKIG